jgi:hypothetical protein
MCGGIFKQTSAREFQWHVDGEIAASVLLTVFAIQRLRLKEHRRGLGARSSSKNSMCDELVDNQGHDDSRKNEHPIGNLHARYRCFLVKPFHGVPTR